MKKSDIHNSADLFLYKAIIDLNSAKYLLNGFNEDNIEIDMDKIWSQWKKLLEEVPEIGV